MSDLRTILEGASTPEIASAVDETFREISKHFVTHNWKTAGLDAGHFVEAVRRFLEFRLFGKATPIGKSLPRFNEAALKSYESATGDESYRVLIPRLLWSLYALRNKRSIGHLGATPATQIDATILLYGAKWVLSEIVRLESTGPADEGLALISRLIERQIEVLWRDGDIKRILNPRIPTRSQVLLLLFLIGNQTADELQLTTGYKNKSNFRSILKRLHDARLIEFDRTNCILSPTGSREAEAILAERGLI